MSRVIARDRACTRVTPRNLHGKEGSPVRKRALPKRRSRRFFVQIGLLLVERAVGTPQPDILTIRGEMNVTAPGQGVVLQNAGLVIDILGLDSESFIERGPHEELDYFLQGNAALVQSLCAALGAS
jgi:hypothetical protein